MADSAKHNGAMKRHSATTMRIDIRPPTGAHKHDPSRGAPGRSGTEAYTSRSRREHPRFSTEYARLLESVYDGVVIADSEGLITDVNGRLLEFLAADERDILGSSVLNFISGASHELLDAIRHNLSQHRYTLIEAFCVRADGTIFPTEIAVNRVDLDENRQLSFFIRDVTVRKQAEDAREAAMARLEEHDRQRLQFVANVSHELRTPLTSMIYAVSNLLRGVVAPLPERVREYLEMLASDCKRLLATVNDILDLRRVEESSLTMNKTRVPFGRLVRRTVDGFAVQAGQKGLSVGVELQGRPLFVDCDVQKMERVLINIVGNAVKFTPEGGTIAIRLDPRGQEELCLTVADSGIGIPPEEIEKVTARYYTVGTQPTGAGLGLALAKEIVGLHGGRLQIESPVPGSNRGTRVSVVLPMVESAYILTVSSDAAHRQELAEKFELQGYRVRLATTAADLQEELSRSRPDVVLLDLAGQEQELRNAVLRMKSRRGGMRLPLVALMPQEASEDTTMVLRSFSVNMLDGDSTSEEVLDTVTGSFLTKAGFGGPAALRIDRAARSGGRSRIQETLENG